MKPCGPAGLVIALALAGCASKADAPSSLPPTTVQAPDHPATPDDVRVELTGRLLAHDGSPLRRAEVIVRRSGFLESTAREALDDDGGFRVSVPAGVYDISIAAVDHRVVSRRVMLTDEVRVEGRMGTYARVDPGEALALHGEYLDAEGKVVAPGPTSAARVSPGVYRLELTTRPPGAARLRYQLVAPSGRSSNGPLADDYEGDGGGDFWSIVDVSAKNALELHLSALPPAGVRPQLHWAGETATATAMLDFQERWTDAIGELFDRAPRQDGQLLELPDALIAELAELAAKARQEADAATDPTLQALLRASQMSVFTLFLVTAKAKGVEQVEEELGWIIDHVAPTEPHLALLLGFGNVMFAARRNGDDAFLARADAWLEQQAREHPDPGVAIGALNTLVYAADARGDQARVQELYALAMDERFDGTFQQEYVRKDFDPNRVLRRGKPFPAFDFAGLRDTDARVTSTGRAGTIYLIEFWATWCGPCVADMPKLHATYAAINGAKPGKGKGKAKNGSDAGLRRLRSVERPRVEFVFVSLDTSPAEVEAFRKEHWSMPWTHAFVGHAGEKETMKRYGFSGVPTAVLVDAEGTILEVNGPLRGDELQATLERVLAEPARPAR